jgi:tetratricopeptide (TPR) repeat protein
LSGDSAKAPDPVAIRQRILWALDQLPSQNGAHTFEHICFYLARSIVSAQLLYGTGPVSSGGDQGRDHESFIAIADRERVVVTCTTEAEVSVATKIREDLRRATSIGTPIDAVYSFTLARIPVAKRHRLQQEAVANHQVQLEVLDGLAIAEALGESRHWWIVERYLAMEMSERPAAGLTISEMARLLSCGFVRRANETLREPHRTANSVHRSFTLDLMRQGLESARRVALTGIGGLGKTTMAREWVRSHLQSFENVLWLSGATDERIDSECLRIAVTMGAVDPDSSPSEAQAAVALILNERTLVVLDGCVNGDHAVRRFPSATLLVTSRAEAGWSPLGFSQLRLAPWTADETAEFLSLSAPLTGADVDALVLTDLLGGLPLAIAQAAAYLDRTRINFEEFVNRLTTHARSVFETPLNSDYPQTLESVWSLALDDLKTQNLAAGQLLEYLSFLGADEIPIATLLRLVDPPEPLRSAVADPMRFDDIRSALLSNSLCEVTRSGFRVHGLVQSIVAARIDSEGTSNILADLTTSILDCTPDETRPSAWPLWEGVINQVDAVLRASFSYGVPSADLRSLASHYADALTHRGFASAGLSLRQTVVGFIIEHADWYHPRTLAAAAHDLGMSFATVGQSEQAAFVYRMAVDIDRQFEDCHTPRHVASMVGLVGAMTDTGEHEAAVNLAYEMIAHYEAHGAREGRLGIEVHGTAGRLLERVGRCEESRVELNTALGLARAGCFRYEEALTLLHLANLDRAEGRLDDVRHRLEAAISVIDGIDDYFYVRAALHQDVAGTYAEAKEWDACRRHIDLAFAQLAILPNGAASTLAGSLLYLDALVRLYGDHDVRGAVAKAGASLDILCALMEPGHGFRRRTGALLLRIADHFGNEQLRAEVMEREPASADHKSGALTERLVSFQPEGRVDL